MRVHISFAIFVAFGVISSSCSVLGDDGHSVGNKSPRRTSRNTCSQGHRRNFQTNKCDPTCSSAVYPCVNGKCGPSNTCDCNFGYELSKSQIFVCERIECDENCRFGKCAAKDQPCQCDKGYVRSGDECRLPICEKPGCAEHEECVGDNQCTCIEGYGKSSYDSKCKPWCESDQTIGGPECTLRSCAWGLIPCTFSVLAGIIFWFCSCWF